MKRIYLILLVAASALSLASCEEKTHKEKFNDKMEDAGDNIKDAADEVGDAAHDEAKKAKNKVD